MSQPDNPQPPDPLTAVLSALKATSAELKATKAEVVRLRTYGKRNRLFIVFDVVLTVLLSGVGAISVHAVQSAGHANSAQLALCQAGNTARAQQVTLWTHLLALPPAPGAPKRTPAQKKQVTEFEAYIHSIFHPRDCAALGKGGH
jgi:hypothetical protein